LVYRYAARTGTLTTARATQHRECAIASSSSARGRRFGNWRRRRPSYRHRRRFFDHYWRRVWSAGERGLYYYYYLLLLYYLISRPSEFLALKINADKKSRSQSVHSLQLRRARLVYYTTYNTITLYAVIHGNKHYFTAFDCALLLLLDAPGIDYRRRRRRVDGWMDDE